jgi:hypothetical protein
MRNASTGMAAKNYYGEGITRTPSCMITNIEADTMGNGRDTTIDGNASCSSKVAAALATTGNCSGILNQEIFKIIQTVDLGLDALYRQHSQTQRTEILASATRTTHGLSRIYFSRQ